MRGKTLKKLFIGFASLFAVALYAPVGEAATTAPCLETCLNTVVNADIQLICCARTNSEHLCKDLDEYCINACACGNGALDTTCDVTEQCDDGNGMLSNGNGQNGDGCDTSCMLECGNGVLDPNEQCDDGNTESGDGCDKGCQIEDRQVPYEVATASISYRGQIYPASQFDEVAKMALSDFKIKPEGSTTLVLKGVGFADPTAIGKFSVMGKQALAIHAAQIAAQIAAGNFTFTGGESVAYADYPGCYRGKNVQIFPGVFGKGCKETPMTLWMDVQACPASAGCCIEPMPGTTTPKSLTDPTLNRDYQCYISAGSASATPGYVDPATNKVGNGYY